eukprot:TRINITY_DN801_c0_g1_i1.p1 TRINITY_DN801_c0_g1~~TRINITY_DN801_c0_g1_i1.p1  ORF type:complete len:180 (-),score=64.33 TRINITY_DN801_c0_g1_i1:141-680(-)
MSDSEAPIKPPGSGNALFIKSAGIHDFKAGATKWNELSESKKQEYSTKAYLQKAVYIWQLAHYKESHPEYDESARKSKPKREGYTIFVEEKKFEGFSPSEIAEKWEKLDSSEKKEYKEKLDKKKAKEKEENKKDKDKEKEKEKEKEKKKKKDSDDESDAPKKKKGKVTPPSSDSSDTDD